MSIFRDFLFKNQSLLDLSLVLVLVAVVVIIIVDASGGESGGKF